MKVVLFNGNIMIHLRKAKNVQGKELIFENKCKRAIHGTHTQYRKIITFRHFSSK